MQTKCGKYPKEMWKNRMRFFCVSGFYFRYFSLSFFQCFFMTNVWNVMPLATVSQCMYVRVCVYAVWYVWELSLASKLSRKIVTWKHINKTHKHSRKYKVEPNEKDRYVWGSVCARLFACMIRIGWEIIYVWVRARARSYTHTHTHSSPKHNYVCFTHKISLTLADWLAGYNSSILFFYFYFFFFLLYLETNETCDSALNYTPSFAAPMCKHSYEKLVQLTFNKTRKKVRYIRR